MWKLDLGKKKREYDCKIDNETTLDLSSHLKNIDISDEKASPRNKDV